MFRWISRQRLVLAGMVGGIAVGRLAPELAEKLAPFGEVYISLLTMCILPILISAIVSGLGSLVTSSETRGHVRPLGLFFASGLLMASAIGMMTGFLVAPGTGLADSAKLELGRLMTFVAEPQSPSGQTGIIGFLHNLIPQNIFEALSSGQSMRIVFVSLLVALALGQVSSRMKSEAVDVAQLMYEVFNKIFEWMTSGLPAGLFCIFAAQASVFSPEVFRALFKFIGALYAAGFALGCIHYLVMRWCLRGVDGARPLHALKDTLTLSYVTSNSFVGLPRAISALRDDLGVDRKISSIVVPLGLVLNRQGNVLTFSLMGVFIAQIYGVPLGIGSMAALLVYSAFAGMAAIVEAPAMGPLLVLFLQPMGLPVAPALVVIIAGNMLIERLEETLNIFASCATATAVACSARSGAAKAPATVLQAATG